jgi:hypothetical protein
MHGLATTKDMAYKKMPFVNTASLIPVFMDLDLRLLLLA